MINSKGQITYYYTGYGRINKLVSEALAVGTEKAIPGPVLIIKNNGDFVINKNGVLTGYKGSDTNVSIPDGVLAIGNNAFKENTAIQSVYLPGSVTSIGNSAFSGCSNLTQKSICPKV